MKKLFTVVLASVILLIMLASGASANHIPQSRYAQWYHAFTDYPGGSFWSPQPIGSTPIYGYYDDYYGGYAYSRGYSTGRYSGYYPGPYAYGGYYSNYYDYPTYNRYNYDGYSQNDPYCRYSDGSTCSGRIVYPQSGLGYYYDAPYQSSNRGYYPNYLSYGWE